MTTTTTTTTSGAADLPEALRRSTAADGKTELFNLPGYPLMVRAVDFNRVHTESEMRRAALLDEMQKAALAAGQATAAPAPLSDDVSQKTWALLDELEKLRGANRDEEDWVTLNRRDDELRAALDAQGENHDR